MSAPRVRSVAEIARSVAAGEVSPSEVVMAAIERLTAGDRTYRVVSHALYDEAMEHARAADGAVARGDSLGPLHGVPVGVKDLYDIAGHPTAAGSTILAGNMASTTATAVERLQAAGAIVVAKTTMTEFAGGAHNQALPVPVNPYDHSHGCGTCAALRVCRCRGVWMPRACRTASS